ncbi:helix-turn-helix transcriptional regulator, partial [Citrobacter braakii]|uniref:helix-turn-helix transcriptional regulator n=1 Tax=Citrobacter braakii TaxID=57706 RepID=UPI0039752CF8
MHTVSSAPPSPTAAHPIPVSAPAQERFLRLPEVIHQCGLSRSTLYDLIARNAFP